MGGKRNTDLPDRIQWAFVGILSLLLAVTSVVWGWSHAWAICIGLTFLLLGENYKHRLYNAEKEFYAASKRRVDILGLLWTWCIWLILRALFSTHDGDPPPPTEQPEESSSLLLDDNDSSGIFGFVLNIFSTASNNVAKVEIGLQGVLLTILCLAYLVERPSRVFLLNISLWCVGLAISSTCVSSLDNETSTWVLVRAILFLLLYISTQILQLFRLHHFSSMPEWQLERWNHRAQFYYMRQHRILASAWVLFAFPYIAALCALIQITMVMVTIAYTLSSSPGQRPEQAMRQDQLQLMLPLTHRPFNLQNRQNFDRATLTESQQFAVENELSKEDTSVSRRSNRNKRSSKSNRHSSRGPSPSSSKKKWESSSPISINNDCLPIVGRKSQPPPPESKHPSGLPITIK